MNRLLTRLVMISLIFPSFTLAGTTGKITGKVADKQTGAALPGVNVVIDQTTMGAATDLNGVFVILNVPPGTYSVTASMIGYNKVQYTNVRATVDLTTTINFELPPTVLEVSETVTVVAERPLVRKDVTHSRAVVGAQEMQELPVENFHQVLELQAGVVQGSGGEIHIRGGRSGEVAYMVDGISVTDPMYAGMAVSVENEAIQEVELISGTFNAEYGQAMSGVVNIVTKEGSKNYNGEVVGYISDYVSTHKELFDKIEDLDPLNTVDVRSTFSGPVPFTGDKLTFFLNNRLYHSDGWLVGERRYSPSDSNHYSGADPTEWHVEQTGNGEIVPLNVYSKISGRWKLAYQFTPNIKLTVGGSLEADSSKSYSHKFKYTPDGRPTGYGLDMSNVVTFTHMLSPKTFYEIKYSNIGINGKSYLYENPEDPRYVSPVRFQNVAGYRFYAGGTSMGHSYRNTLTHRYKAEITSQVNQTHQVKAGVEYVWSRLFREYYTIILDQSTDWKPEVPPIWSPAHDRYTNHPKEFSAYWQDKIELKDMIVNLGVRFEYFDADGRVPTDLRDPDIWHPSRFHSVWAVAGSDTQLVRLPVRVFNGDTTFVDPQTGEPLGSTVNDAVLIDYVSKTPRYFGGARSLIDTLKRTPIVNQGNATWFTKSENKIQISPRIGIAYPITDKGVIHFSYGHFLQIPANNYLFANPEFEVIGGGLNTSIGNANLEPQRTVSYEIGLQQQIASDIGLTITGFYKDIRNLLGVKIIQTYIGGDSYALYTNRDYGNVRGITIALDKRHSNGVSAKLDYTFSVAEGNASDPLAAFYDAQSGRDPEKQLVPLDWDQTHTLNGSLTFGDPGRWGVSFIGQFGSGLPYTPTAEGQRVAYENSERKPMILNLDMRAYRTYHLNNLKLSVYLNIYNLFDRKNERYVYTDTGRATYTLIPFYAGEVYGPNTLEEYLVRPDYYSSPRQVKLGIAVGF